MDTNYSIVDSVTDILNSKYIFAVLAIIAFAYAQRSAPTLPDWMIKIFSNDIVRVLYLSLLLFVRFDTRPTVAIIISLFFVYALQCIYVKETMETYKNIRKYNHHINHIHENRAHKNKNKNKNNENKTVDEVTFSGESLKHENSSHNDSKERNNSKGENKLTEHVHNIDGHKVELGIETIDDVRIVIELVGELSSVFV